MITGRWRVCFTPWAARWASDSKLPFERRWLEDWDEWLRREDVLPRTPFLISPGCEYDVALNEFFLDSPMAARAPRTLEAYAHDLARSLNFLWLSREDKSWRDVTAADHVAYLSWRRRDAAGPRVAGSTWNREVAAVNQFYRWAVQRGVSGRTRSRRPPKGGRPRRRAGLAARGRESSARRRMRMTRRESASSGCRPLLTVCGEISHGPAPGRFPRPVGGSPPADGSSSRSGPVSLLACPSPRCPSDAPAYTKRSSTP